MNMNSCPFILMYESIASLVVPAISVTITLSSPKILFVKDDLPTFGFPIKATFNKFSFSSKSLSSGKFFTISSRRSPMPRPCSADIDIGSPKASS